MSDGIVTWMILAVTVLVSWQAWEKPRLQERLILWPPAIDRRKEYDRLLTYGLIHADGMHLAFNMLTLYSFGMLMERYFSASIGSMGYLLFYLSALVVSILPSYLRHRHNARYAALGASGAVLAVLFSSILLDPWMLIWLFFVIPVPAFAYAGLFLWFCIWMDRRGRGNTNHNGHLWGALYGLAFALVNEPALAGHFVARLLSPSFGG